MGLKEKIGDTRETQTIANIYNHIRRASHLLSLPDFIATTLEDEINSLVSNFRTIDNLNIETGIYSKNGWKDVSPLIQRRIYSIVRELFLNSMKHSEAKNISVQIVKHDKYITLTYEDDGKGYNPEQIKESKGYKDIKELVRALDADVIDDSRENEGVILTFKIPF
jgi:signal transduction histidine kinase